MENIVKQKNLIWVEWTQLIPSRCNSTVVSSSFILLSGQCEFEFRTRKAFPFSTSCLYMKSNMKLIPTVDVIVRVASDSLPNNFTFLSEKQGVKSGTQKIWKCADNRLLGARLTFQIISHMEERQSEPISVKYVLPESPLTSHATKNIHLRALSRDFSKMLNKTSNCDIEITCEDKTFKAHRIILEARCGIFFSYAQK